MGYKIDRMAYDGGIIREGNMALLNHNKCVDKINEVIEVLNAQEIEPSIKRSIFCCSKMAQAINDRVFKIVSYMTGHKRVQYLSFSFKDDNYSQSIIIYYCPFCGKTFDIDKKALCTEEQLILNHQEQEQILRNLSGLCERYGKYACAIFDFYQGKNTKHTPTNYNLFLKHIKKAIIKSLTYYKLPLLDTSPFSSLKENIKYIVGEVTLDTGVCADPDLLNEGF